MILFAGHWHADTRSGAAVNYRLAPEHPFPAAADDAYAALQWAAAHGPGHGFDSERLAVCGDSAGGNLAAVAAQRARGRIGLRAQILLYPVTDLSSTDTESYRLFSEGYFLNRDVMRKFIELYTPEPARRRDPAASPLLAADFSGLAPALVLTAAFDVLRDEGEAYAARLKEDGVDVEQHRAAGMLHGFMTMDGIIPGTADWHRVVCRYAAKKLGGPVAAKERTAP
jgi:acetyl esterase